MSSMSETLYKNCSRTNVTFMKLTIGRIKISITIRPIHFASGGAWLDGVLIVRIRVCFPLHQAEFCKTDLLGLVVSSIADFRAVTVDAVL